MSSKSPDNTSEGRSLEAAVARAIRTSRNWQYAFWAISLLWLLAVGGAVWLFSSSVNRFNQTEKGIQDLGEEAKNLETDLGNLKNDLVNQLREVGLVAYCLMGDDVPAEKVANEPKIIDFSNVSIGKKLVTRSPWRFKAEKSGDYIISTSVGLQGSKGANMELGLCIGKTPTDRDFSMFLARKELGPEQTTIGGTTTVALKEGTWIDIRLQAINAGNATVLTNRLTWITITYLGPQPPE